MAQLLLANPRKRRRSTAKKRRSITKRARPATKKTVTVTKYRRNPSGRMGGIIGTLKEGAIGAGGAVAVEVILSKLPLPAALSEGNGKVAAKVLGGVALGYAVSKFGKKSALGKTLAQGAVTVALHDTIRNMVGPSMGLSGDTLLASDWDDMGYWGAGQTYDAPAAMDGYYDMPNSVDFE